MYQVVEMYGENEPWWFFEEWREDIISEQLFSTFTEAESYFLSMYDKLEDEYEKNRCKNLYMVAFWNEGELIFCEDCDEDLQAYKGLILLKDNKKIDDKDNENNETVDHSGKAKCCSRLSKGSRC